MIRCSDASESAVTVSTGVPGAPKVTSTGAGMSVRTVIVLAIGPPELSTAISMTEPRFVGSEGVPHAASAIVTAAARPRRAM